jgi:transcriptional regulator with XRE-family HTH domain
MDPIKTELTQALKTQSQSQLARAMRISPQMMCDILAGRRAYSPRLLKYFGYRRVEVFEKIRPN